LVVTGSVTVSACVYEVGQSVVPWWHDPILGGLVVKPLDYLMLLESCVE